MKIGGKLRQKIAFFLFVLMLALLVGGVGLTQEKITLIFRQNDPPADAAGLPQAVAEFDRNHPNIKVKYESVPWSDALNQFIREAGVGTGPDVLQLAFVWTRDLAKAGTLVKLNPLIKQYPLPYGIEDFVAVELGILDEGIYGIPWTTDTFAMIYRKDFFEEAGIAPFPDDSWEHFKEVAGKLTKDRDGDGVIDQYGFAFPAGSGSTGGMWFLVNYFIWSNGYTFIKQSSEGGWQIGVDAGAIAETMRYFNSFFEEGITPRSLIAVDSWGDPELIYGLAKGDFAMGFMPPASFRAAMNANPEAPLFSAQVPAGRVTRRTHLGGRTLAINKNTKHIKEAWDLLKWMCSEYVFETYYRQQFSAQKTLLKKIKYGPEYEGYVKLIPQAQTFYTYIISPVRVQTMWALTNREFAAVYSGQKSIEEASKELISRIRKALEEALKES